MDQHTHQWQGLYDPGLVSHPVETLILDLWLGQYWEFEAVYDEKTVFLVDSPSSSVPTVHTVDGALLVGVG
jgi:hypothetical protein